jgi:hypothetical protein
VSVELAEARPRTVPGDRVRRRPVTLLAAAAAAALHVALGAGALAGAPAGVRIVLALVARVLGPGLALTAVLDRPPGGALCIPGWALGFGVAWNAALVMATRAMGLPFTVLLPWAVAADVALLAVCAIAAARRPAGGAVDPARTPAARRVASAPGDLVVAPTASAAAAPRPGRPAQAAIVLALLAAATHAARVGTPVTYYSDSPDHIGTIRRMLEHGDAFPNDAFFRDAGAAGIDPRKGLWHPQVALVAGLAHADPIETWRTLPVVLSPLFVLNVAALGMLLAGGAGAAVGAWAWPLTYGGGLAAQPVRETGFATKLGDQLALAAAVAVLADLARRTGRSRAAAVVLGAAAVATHVFAAVQFALALGALGIGLVVRERGIGRDARRLAVTTASMALVALPWLVWRAHGVHTVNPIHTEPQGLLTLWGTARIVDIGVLWDWMGRLWVLVPLAWSPRCSPGSAIC